MRRVFRPLGSLALLVVFAAIPSGCAHYTTPGRAANLTAIDRSDIRREMEREPAVSFPARLAILRVQAPDYRSQTYAGAGPRAGEFSVLTVQELLRAEQLAAMEAWPSVAGVAPVNRLLLPEQMNGMDDLRLAAAKLQADVLLLYTVDTKFEVRRKSVLPIGVISLGTAPDRDAHVTTTASALLVDVRTGFVYGVAEATARKDGLANFWSTGEQLDKRRFEAEDEAFGSLIGELAEAWRGVVQKQAAAEPAKEPSEAQAVSDIL
jgi:hypothetical protein